MRYIPASPKQATDARLQALVGVERMTALPSTQRDFLAAALEDVRCVFDTHTEQVRSRDSVLAELRQDLRLAESRVSEAVRMAEMESRSGFVSLSTKSRVLEAHEIVSYLKAQIDNI